MKLLRIKLYFFIDRIYGLLLSLTHYKEIKRKELVLSDIQHLKNIFKSAYKDSMEFSNYMDTVNTVSDLCDYLCCDYLSQLEFLVEDDFYIFLINRFDSLQIVDFAAKDGKCQNIFKVLSFIRSTIKKTKKKRLRLKAREKTSYPIILSLVKSGKIIILHDSIITLKNEKSHKLIVEVIGTI